MQLAKNRSQAICKVPVQGAACRRVGISEIANGDVSKWGCLNLVKEKGRISKYVNINWAYNNRTCVPSSFFAKTFDSEKMGVIWIRTHVPNCLGDVNPDQPSKFHIIQGCHMWDVTVASSFVMAAWVNIISAYARKDKSKAAKEKAQKKAPEKTSRTGSGELVVQCKELYILPKKMP